MPNYSTVTMDEIPARSKGGFDWNKFFGSVPKNGDAFHITKEKDDIAPATISTALVTMHKAKKFEDIQVSVRTMEGKKKDEKITHAYVYRELPAKEEPKKEGN